MKYISDLYAGSTSNAQNNGGGAMQEILQFWKLSEVKKYQANREKLDYAASAKYESVRLAPGDRLWIVTGDRVLYLIGAIQVEQVVGFDDARRILGRVDLYGGARNRFAINKDRSRVPISKGQSLGSIPADLEFLDRKGKPTKPIDVEAITCSGSRVTFGTVLQSPRRLTPESAALLQALLP